MYLNKKSIVRLLALVIVAVLSAVILAGCRSKNSSTNTDPVKTDEPQPTELPDVSPLLWRVTDNAGHTLYLFGTIHVGDNRNNAVLERLAPILDKCDALAVEFDVEAYAKNTQQMMQDMTQYVLTDGSLVSDHMPAELYDRAYKLLQRAGLFPSAFTHYNVAWWSQMVESAALTVYTKLDSEKAMDSLLIRRAYKNSKPVLEVESSGFQMTLLNSFEDELYLMMIEDSLDNTEDLDSQLTELYELWLSGDKDAFWSYLTSEDEIDETAGQYTDAQIAMFENYNRALLDDRNLGMRDRAIEYIAGGRTVFFAVGAAHMANDVGLVKLLADAGYTVEAVSY